MQYRTLGRTGMQVSPAVSRCDPNRRGNSPRWIMQAVEESLRRLDTAWIDLYQAHRWDPDTELDETLGALSDLVSAESSGHSARRPSRCKKIIEGQPSDSGSDVNPVGPYRPNPALDAWGHRRTP